MVESAVSSTAAEGMLQTAIPGIWEKKPVVRKTPGSALTFAENS